MDKAEWNAMRRRDKDRIVVERVMVWTKLEEPVFFPPDEEMDWRKPDGYASMLPMFTTDRNTCALVLDEIMKRSDQALQRFVHELGDALCSPGTAHHQSDDGLSILMHYSILDVLRASPDTLCYCAIKAIEETQREIT